MDKKRYVNRIIANAEYEVGEALNQIFGVAKCVFGDHYNKVIEDKHGCGYMIIEADEAGFNAFKEVVNYKFPNVCDFDI